MRRRPRQNHIMTSSLLILAVSLLLLTTAMHTADAACPENGCGDHGECTQLRTPENCPDLILAEPGEADKVICPKGCKCDYGFTGYACELHSVNKCPNHPETSACFFGGQCIEQDATGFGEDEDTDTTDEPFYCDCTGAEGVLGKNKESRPAIGKKCEFLATTSCSNNGDFDSVAYCTNGGKCFEKDLSMPFLGCSCPGGFQGLHCQYLQGQAPQAEMETVQQLQGIEGEFYKRTNGKKDLSGGAIFGIMLAVALVIGGIGYFILPARAPQTAPEEAPKMTSPEIHDLHLDEVNINGNTATKEVV
jgi:hypothetical protein